MKTNINREILEIKTVEFHANGAHFFSRRVIVARAWTTNDGVSKVQNSFWLGREDNKSILFGSRRDSQSRSTNSFRKCAPQSSHRPLLSFEFPIMSNNNCSCRSGVLLVFQKHWKTISVRRPGPARNGCASGLGRDVFFGGRSRERSVLDRCCRESIKKLSPFDHRSRMGGSRKHQK